jgi:hypothetical protein
MNVRITPKSILVFCCLCILILGRFVFLNRFTTRAVSVEYDARNGAVGDIQIWKSRSEIDRVLTPISVEVIDGEFVTYDRVFATVSTAGREKTVTSIRFDFQKIREKFGIDLTVNVKFDNNKIQLNAETTNRKMEDLFGCQSDKFRTKDDNIIYLKQDNQPCGLVKDSRSMGRDSSYSFPSIYTRFYFVNDRLVSITRDISPLNR